MKIRVKEATGVLAELLANIDERELAKARKRMMLSVKIEKAMKKCGYNQEQFARLMKKSPTVISEWLSGDRNFTIDTLVEIEEALGIRLIDDSVMTVVSANTEMVSHNSKKKSKMSYSGNKGFCANVSEYSNGIKYA